MLHFKVSQATSTAQNVIYAPALLVLAMKSNQMNQCNQLNQLS